MSGAPQRAAQRKFSSDRLVAETVGLYQEVAQEKGF
jgi:hypothetical protein